jgi:hypothetical protein
MKEYDVNYDDKSGEQFGVRRSLRLSSSIVVCM